MINNDMIYSKITELVGGNDLPTIILKLFSLLLEQDSKSRGLFEKILKRETYSCEKPVDCIVKRKNLCKEEKRVCFSVSKGEKKAGEYHDITQKQKNFRTLILGLRASYVLGVYKTHAWTIKGMNCDYPESNIEDVLRCFYYVVPQTMEKTADAFFSDEQLFENNAHELNSFHRAIELILRMYYLINFDIKEKYQDLTNNEEILFHKELQPYFAIILNLDGGFSVDNAADELVPTFDSALTECYHSIYSIMIKYKAERKKLELLLGEKAVAGIKRCRGELYALIYKNDSEQK